MKIFVSTQTSLVGINIKESWQLAPFPPAYSTLECRSNPVGNDWTNQFLDVWQRISWRGHHFVDRELRWTESRSDFNYSRSTDVDHVAVDHRIHDEVWWGFHSEVRQLHGVLVLKHGEKIHGLIKTMASRNCENNFHSKINSTSYFLHTRDSKSKTASNWKTFWRHLNKIKITITDKVANVDKYWNLKLKFCFENRNIINLNSQVLAWWSWPSPQSMFCD